MPNVYFAGPDVFRQNYDAVVKTITELCRDAQITPVMASDNEIKAITVGDKQKIANSIYQINIGLIQKADGVIANLSPFRGPIEPDSGTAFEVGYASALGKWIIGYLDDLRNTPEKVKDSPLRGSADGLTDIFGFKVEDMGYPVNLMLGCSCTKLVRSLKEAVEVVKEGILRGDQSFSKARSMR
jgi:nucleoside 2-deoxyribosyltransferase